MFVAVSLLILLQKKETEHGFSWQVYMPPREVNGQVWFELPGGKIEAGETPEQAMRREIFEELAVTLNSQAALNHLALFVGPSLDGQKKLLFYPFATLSTKLTSGTLIEDYWRDLDSLQEWREETFPITFDMLSWLHAQLNDFGEQVFMPFSYKESTSWIYL